MRTLGVTSAFLAAALMVAGTARSQNEVDSATRQAARTLGQAGVQAFQAGDYSAASTKLEKSYQMFPAPSVGLWSARSLVKQGKLVEGSERYQQTLRLTVSGIDASVQKQSQVDAANELKALGGRIPSIIVQLDGAEPSQVVVSIDGARVPPELVGEKRPTDPGSHKVEGLRGQDHVELAIDLREGEAKSAVLRFSPVEAPPASVGAPPAPGPVPPPSPPPAGWQQPGQPASYPVPPQTSPETPAAHHGSTRTLAFVSLGVGGVALIATGVTGLLALGKKSDLDNDKNCQNFHCLPSESSMVDSYNSLRTISTVSFVLGVALGATGAILLATSGPSEPRVSLRVGPASAAVQGSF
jgi:hypothetical protein